MDGLPGPCEVLSLMKTLAFGVVVLSVSVLFAQQPTHSAGSVRTADVDLGYETYGAQGGNALPVIAVNGGPGLSHAYMVVGDLWQKVALSRLVVFYDPRGTGMSKRVAPNAPQDIDAQVADLEAVRAHLGLEKVALVGDSFGGLISMAYAAAHPEHVGKLVLSDSAAPSLKGMVNLFAQTFPDIEEEDGEVAKKLSADPDAAARAGLKNHFRMIFYSPEKRDAYLAQCGDLGFEPAVNNAVWKSAEKLDLTSALGQFHFPVLVINGRYDMNVAPVTAWNIAHAIPGSQLVFFEKSGHLPAYEEPERYQKVLEDFLNAR